MEHGLRYLIIFVTVGILFAIIRREVIKAEKKMDINNFVIKQPKVIMWLGVGCVLVFGAFLVIMSIFPNDTADWWVYVIFVLFTLSGAFMVLFCIGWEVKIIGNDIYYKSFFKNKSVFTFDDISCVEMKNPESPFKTIKLYSNTRKKLLTIETICSGSNVFIKRLQQKNINFILK
jgi:hypothetical protein